ncbi:MAG: 3' terminal RNA ribose 2'-O-methyltransferase Hen1 [Planctomycetota bacterium]
MFLTLTTTHRPATDLGYLLHKHPDRVQSFELPVGVAHIFYPLADADRCTAALLVEVDPVSLVRGRGDGGGLDQYVNDRPYVASSLLCVALARVFRNAMQGDCKDHEALAQTAIPLEAHLPAVVARGGEALLRRLFEPLGYEVDVVTRPLDERFAEWGASRSVSLTLRATCRLADLLTHLYVLLPVLDDDKHYWVSDDEVQKLLRRGEGWLPTHPERTLITRRYLKHQRSLTRPALEQLLTAEERDPQPAPPDDAAGDDEKPDRREPLNVQRHGAVLAALRSCGAQRVLDLGCGEGRLMRELIKDRQFSEIVGVDVSTTALARAEQRLKLDRLHPARREQVKLLHGSLIYRDRRLHGFDAAAVVEVVEHLDPHRLAAFERVLFGETRPRTVVLTTPNRDYNVLYETLQPGDVRHGDHRFEWSRAEFAAWTSRVASEHGWSVSIEPIGPIHADHGAPTQMAIFTQQ